MRKVSEGVDGLCDIVGSIAYVVATCKLLDVTIKFSAR
jgi:hypothetical protein